MMNTSHSLAKFSDVESTRWLWKWSTELDAFCDSAKSVIRRIGSKLQLEEEEEEGEEEEEEEEEDKVYFRPLSAELHLSLYHLAPGGVGREEEGGDFQEGGVGDSDSGRYLSDLSFSTDLGHDYGYTGTHPRVENTHPPYPDELYPRKRLPATENPPPEIDVVAYFTEYNEEEGDEGLHENHPEEYFENCEVRGRSLKRMAGPIVRAPSPTLVAKERKKSKSSRRRSSSHEEDDPPERERRRQERRKRRAEREGKRVRDARDSADEAGRKEKKERRHRQKKELSPPPPSRQQQQPVPKKAVEGIRKDNKKNRYSVEDILGLSRFVLARLG